MYNFPFYEFTHHILCAKIQQFIEITKQNSEKVTCPSPLPQRRRRWDQGFTERIRGFVEKIGEAPYYYYFCSVNKRRCKNEEVFLFLTILVGTLTAQAEDYTYLTFETTDGAKASVAVADLTPTISGGSSVKLSSYTSGGGGGPGGH